MKTNLLSGKSGIIAGGAIQSGGGKTFQFDSRGLGSGNPDFKATVLIPLKKSSPQLHPVYK
jgi:hypothetical protein